MIMIEPGWFSVWALVAALIMTPFILHGRNKRK